MKKTLSLLLALTAMVSMFTLSASATEVKPIDVRVNDLLVDFPDAKPYVDENGRTLIPLLFVAEELGAEVTWEQDSQTAVITDDATTIRVKIGDADLAVTKDGEEKIVTMDTKAIIKEERTYVPIRFVAEELGAFVGWSNYYNTVEICKEVLTPEQITRLRAYDHTYNDGGRYVPEPARYYATDEINKSFQHSDFGFSNAREFILRWKYPANLTAIGRQTNVTWRINEENQVRKYMNEAVALAEEELNGLGIKANFLTDTSCAYQDSFYDGSHYAFRGILEIELDETDMVEAKETLEWLHIPYVDGQLKYERDFEVRANSPAGKAVSIYGYYLPERFEVTE